MIIIAILLLVLLCLIIFFVENFIQKSIDKKAIKKELEFARKIKQIIPCSACLEADDVVWLSREGRKFEYKPGKFYDIPNDYLIPTCIGCGEEYFTQKITEELETMALASLKEIKNDQKN